MCEKIVVVEKVGIELDSGGGCPESCMECLNGECVKCDFGYKLVKTA